MRESVVEVNFRFSRGLFYDGGVYIYIWVPLYNIHCNNFCSVDGVGISTWRLIRSVGGDRLVGVKR